jgi:hypothetical protein
MVDEGWKVYGVKWNGMGWRKRMDGSMMERLLHRGD